MREDAGKLEAAMEIDGLQEIDHVQIEYADAIHAGIDGEVVFGDHAIEVCLLAQSQRELLRDDRGSKVIRQHIGNGAHRRLRKHQNGSLDTMLAQLNAFFHRGDSQLVNTRLECSARHVHGTMTIAIGLDDCHDLTLEPDTFADDANVVRDGV